MLKKSKKLLLTGFLLIVLPPLFIVMGGIPTLAEVFGYGEGFAYLMAYGLLFCIFVGMVLVMIGLIKMFFVKKQD